MTSPIANIKVNFQQPSGVRIGLKPAFPSSVKGAAFITLTLANGVYTIAPDYTVLGPLPPGFDPTAFEVAVQNFTTKQFETVTIAQLIAAILGVSYRGPITAAGDVTVSASDRTILMQKTVGAATNMLLPTSISRNGLPITVKDLKGDANANNITFVPSGAETIDGFSPAAAVANGIALIDINYGKKTLFPLTAGGWYL